MEDFISRKKAIEWCLEGLNNMPSAQQEMRCEDCDYGEAAGTSIYCLIHSTYMRCMDYCSYWQKGEKNDTD